MKSDARKTSDEASVSSGHCQLGMSCPRLDDVDPFPLLMLLHPDNGNLYLRRTYEAEKVVWINTWKADETTVESCCCSYFGTATFDRQTS